MSKINYSSMTSDELHSEHKKLNKKLILPNILIVIIAVVACLAQLLMPFFKVSIKLNSDVVTSLVDTLYADYDDNTPIVESENTVVSKLTTKTNIKKMTKDLNSTITIPLTATELSSVAFASDDAAEDEVISLLAGIIEKMDIGDELESVLAAMMPTVISTYVTEQITTAVTETLAEDEELTAEQTEAINTAAETIETSIQKLAEASTAEELEVVKEEVKTEVTDTVTQTMTDLNLSEEKIASVTETIESNFDEIISYATGEDGTLSYTELLNNLDSVIALFTDSSSSDDSDGDSSAEAELTEELIALALSQISDEIKTAILSTLSEEQLAAMTETERNRYIYDYYMTYYASSSGSVNDNSAIRYSLTEDSTASSGSSESSGEDATATITKYINYINNEDYEGLITEILGEDGLDDGTLQTIKTAALGLFIFDCVTAALWAILAILALVHIFIPNKKVGMWYVKLFGGLSAFLFYAIPAVLVLAAGALVPTLASALSIDSGILTTIFGGISFGGSGLIVLICLLALWLVSIFWCHPIKKKIKACRNEIKAIG